ncbi:MAG: UDP-N-acetylglucosamine 2-epimerase (non-hydrolyzing), partial [Planctomycetota bacterium]
VNRRVAGVCADYHFPPTPASKQNLLREGVPAADIVLTGNTVVDALQWMEARLDGIPLPDGIGDAGRLILVTAHRHESFGEPFRNLCFALRDLAERFDDVQLVYPVHLNPNVRAPVNEILAGNPRIRLLEPLPYDRFVRLLYRADLILTDSGGIQEEAPALGKPTLVLREKTERPEAVQAGVVRLVGTDRRRIVEQASRLLSDPEAYAAMARRMFVYGDGRASQRIGEVLVDGRLTTPEFAPQLD